MDVLALKEISSWCVPSPEDAPVRSLPQRQNAGAQYWSEMFNVGLRA